MQFYGWCDVSPSGNYCTLGRRIHRSQVVVVAGKSGKLRRIIFVSKSRIIFFVSKRMSFASQR